MLIYTARPLKIAQDQYKRIYRNFTQGYNTKEEQRAVTRGSLAACYCFYTTGNEKSSNERIPWESLCERLSRPSESLFHLQVLQQAHDLGLTKGFPPAGPRGKLPCACAAGPATRTAPPGSENLDCGRQDTGQVRFLVYLCFVLGNHLLPGIISGKCSSSGRTALVQALVTGFCWWPHLRSPSSSG